MNLFIILFRDLNQRRPVRQTQLGCIRSVCSSSSFHFLSSPLISCRRSACSTSVSVSMAFGGGQSWTINPEDFNVGQLDSRDPTTCLGALFDLSQDSNIAPTDGNPDWVVGDTFLVRNSSCFIILNADALIIPPPSPPKKKSF